MTHSKQSLRDYHRHWRSKLNHSFIKESESLVTHQLTSYFNSQSTLNYVATYYPIQNELSPLQFLNQSTHRLTFPRFNTETNCYEMAEIKCLENDFELGHFNCLEAKQHCRRINSDDISHWLIPGLAFDKKGHRLGFGAGIYDRLLKESKGIKMGLAYEEQIIQSVPTEKHDQIMDLIITPNSIYKT